VRSVCSLTLALPAGAEGEPLNDPMQWSPMLGEPLKDPVQCLAAPLAIPAVAFGRLLLTCLLGARLVCQTVTCRFW